MDDIAEIKRAFVSLMNGELSKALRQNGLGYRVIYGVSWVQLTELARGIPKNASLGRKLWKEREIRECRLLAGLVMPATEMTEEEPDRWIADMRFSEEAFYTTSALFSRLKNRSSKAFKWTGRREEMFNLCGWLLMARLFAEGGKLQERSENHFVDQAASVLTGRNGEVKRACRNAVLKYSLIGKREYLRVKSLLQMP